MAVYDDEKNKDSTTLPNDDDLRSITGINKAEEAAIDDSATKGGDSLPEKENAVASNPLNTLADAAKDGASMYKPGAGKPGLKQKGRMPQITKKQGGVIGGLIAAGAAVIIGISTLGPLQFIHFAQILQAFHFSDQQDASESRIKKLLIYSKTKDINKTRLGYIANAQANNIDKKMKANGWVIESSKAGNFSGFTYDPSIGENPVSEKNTAEHNRQMKAALEKEGVKGVTIETVTVKEGNVTKTKSVVKVPPEGMKAWANMSLIKTIYSGNRDVGKITSAYEKRLLIKRAGISFNPLTKLDNKIREAALKKLQEEREKRLAGKKTPPEMKATINDADRAKPPDGVNPDEVVNETEQLQQEAANEPTDATKEKLKAKLAAKGAGAAAVVGLLCMARNMAGQVDENRLLAAQIPAMQASAEVLAVGSKAMAGDDVDMQALGEYAKSLSSKSNKSSWAQASTIMYEQGKTGTGTTLPPELDPSPDQSAITQAIGSIPGIDKVCGVLENTFVQIVSLAIGAITGPVTTIAAVVLTGPVSDKIISLFSAETVNLADAKYAGGPYGEAVNVGTRLVANETAFSMGGRPLSSSEELALKEQTQQQKQAEDKTRSIADRFFNPYKYDTPVAAVIDAVNPKDPGAAIAKIPSLIGSSLLSPFAKKANAADATTPEQAYYGIKKVGFAPGTLESRENPYINASNAESILTGQNGGKYVDLLKTCNKINAAVETIDGLSAVNYTSEEGTGEAPATMGDYSKLPAECKDDSDSNFLTVRAAAFDTLTMEAFSCTEFNDPTSCAAIMPTAATGDSGVGQPSPSVMTRFGPFTFPISASKDELMNTKPAHWCYTKQDVTCHGTEDDKYYASDIFIKQGVTIVSATDGKVVKVGTPSAFGQSITIKANDCNDTGTDLSCVGEGSLFFYNHMTPGSEKVKVGDIVKSGQPIGISGNDSNTGNGSQSHLHFDVSDRKNQYRGDCQRSNLGACVADGMINVQPELYKSFQNIGNASDGGNTVVGGWQWPLKNKVTINTCFAQQVSRGAHAGLDLAARDVPVYAAAGGKVLRISPLGGNTDAIIIIEHQLADGKKVYSNYQHVVKSSIKVKVGDSVQAGTELAVSGGDPSLDQYSSGKHLHFGISTDPALLAYADMGKGGIINPLFYINDNQPYGNCSISPQKS